MAATDPGKPGVRVARSKGTPEAKCESGCLIGHEYGPSYPGNREHAIRIAVRAHVRDTGHAVTVSVTEETRYER